MTRCASCGATGLHLEYRTLRGLGQRPVLCERDGREHQCLPRVVEGRDGRPERRDNQKVVYKR